MTGMLSRWQAGDLQSHEIKALARAAAPAGAVTENTPHEPVTANYSISAGRSASRKEQIGMEPIEIIYNGYIEEREGIDTAETNEAADNLMAMIGSLLPNSDKMQDILYMECLHLAELSQKQGFMAGFAFAIEVFGPGRVARQGKEVEGIAG